MKKSLIALAIASAVSAPAFAATSNVDVYGVINMSVNFYNDQDPDNSDIQVTSNASRIGFKGSEDLGGGLSAIWQIESGFNGDEANGTWASRNTFLGLKGNWGTALLGNHDTPFKLVGRAVDLFGDTIADSRNIMGYYDAVTTSDMRAKNVIAYISPNFDGFNAAVAYTTDPIFSGTGADNNDLSVWSVNATYSNGPLYLGGAYSDGDGLNALGQDDNWRLAAGFTFGDFRVVGQYDQYDANDSGSDFSAWMVGGSWTMGAWVFKANYIAGEVDSCTGDYCDPDQWTIGADYNLSKRTTVYGLYTSASGATALGSGANDSDWNWPETDQVGGFALGLKHTF